MNVTIKKQPQDMVIKNLNIGLYPKQEGKLAIDKVQIPGVNTWTDITATTTYANKNLFLHNLTLDQNNKFQTVNIDASKVAQGKLGVNFKGTLGGGDVASQMELSTVGHELPGEHERAREGHLARQARAVAGRKSPGQFSGDVKSADIDLKGALDKPASWDGKINTEISNVKAGNFQLDNVKLDVDAANGHATVHEARIDQGKNHVQLHGSIDLPETAGGFGTTPGNLQISIDAPDLQQLTSFLTTPATGSLQANGNLKTGNGKSGGRPEGRTASRSTSTAHPWSR